VAPPKSAEGVSPIRHLRAMDHHSRTDERGGGIDVGAQHVRNLREKNIANRPATDRCDCAK